MKQFIQISHFMRSLVKRHLSLISGVPVLLTAPNIFCFEIRKAPQMEDNDHCVYIYSIEVNGLAGLDA